MKIISFLFIMLFTGCDFGNGEKVKGKSVSFPLKEKIVSVQDSFAGVLILKADSAFLEQVSFPVLNPDKSIFTEIATTADKEPSSNELKENNILAYYPDYYIIHFEANDEKDAYFPVKIGNSVKYIKKGRYMEYLTWSNYILRSFVVTTDKNPLRIEPKATSKIILDLNYSELSFVCNEISGDWVKVSCNAACEGCPDGDKMVSGWIRWRENGKIMLKLYYTC